MRRGFTLIELILVIGLIALIGGLVAVNAEAILRGLAEEPPERILQKAVREARFQAAHLKQPVLLRFDEEAAAFRVRGADGSDLATFKTGLENAAPPLRLQFEQILPGRGMDRPDREQTAPIDAVTFRPDRSSTPFQAVLRNAGGSFTLRFDPFSDIVLHDSRNL